MGLFDTWDIFGDLFEGDVSATAAPRVSPAQQSLIDAVSKWLEPQIGKGAAPYPGKLAADVPGLFTQAYGAFEQAFTGALGGLTGQTIQDLISGKPAYEFDPKATGKRWQETYAGPVMEAWRENILPAIKEGFNLPGVLYSRGRGEGVTKAAGEFYGQYVAPTLFSALQAGEQMGAQSLEAAAGRQPAALGLPGQQFAQAAGVSGTLQQQQQAQLTAQYQEWLRTRAEPGWAAQAAMGFGVQPTLDWGMFREPSMIEQLAGPAMAAAMMA